MWPGCEALTRGYVNRLTAAACAVAHLCVQVHAQSFPVVRETYLRLPQCFHRPLCFEWLKIPLVTTTTVNEYVLLCPQLIVFGYRNVLISQLNVRL